MKANRTVGGVVALVALAGGVQVMGGIALRRTATH